MVLILEIYFLWVFKFMCMLFCKSVFMFVSGTKSVFEKLAFIILLKTYVFICLENVPKTLVPCAKTLCGFSVGICLDLISMHAVLQRLQVITEALAT